MVELQSSDLLFLAAVAVIALTITCFFGVIIGKFIIKMQNRRKMLNLFEGGVETVFDLLSNGKRVKHIASNHQQAPKEPSLGPGVLAVFVFSGLLFALFTLVKSDKGKSLITQQKNSPTELQAMNVLPDIPDLPDIYRDDGENKPTKNIEDHTTTRPKKENIYDVRIDGVVHEELKQETQQLSEKLDTEPIKSEPVIAPKISMQKEVFTVQYSANSMRKYAENNKEKLDQQFSNYWTYILEDPYERKSKVFIGQFDTEEEAKAFSKKLNRSTQIVQIRVKV